MAAQSYPNSCVGTIIRALALRYGSDKPRAMLAEGVEIPQIFTLLCELDLNRSGEGTAPLSPPYAGPPLEGRATLFAYSTLHRALNSNDFITEPKIGTVGSWGIHRLRRVKLILPPAAPCDSPPTGKPLLLEATSGDVPKARRKRVAPDVNMVLSVLLELGVEHCRETRRESLAQEVCDLLKWNRERLSRSTLQRALAKLPEP
jgi:hypothetical protein